MKESDNYGTNMKRSNIPSSCAVTCKLTSKLVVTPTFTGIFEFRVSISCLVASRDAVLTRVALPPTWSRDLVSQDTWVLFSITPKFDPRDNWLNILIEIYASALSTEQGRVPRTMFVTIGFSDRSIVHWGLDSVSTPTLPPILDTSI